MKFGPTNPNAMRPGQAAPTRPMAGVKKPPAGGAMPAGLAEYAKTARAGMNLTNSGTPNQPNKAGGSFMGGMKQLGVARGMNKGGAVGSASKRADGIAQQGKTNCKMR